MPGINRVNSELAPPLDEKMIEKIAADLKSNVCPVAEKTEYINAPSQFFTNYAMNISPSINETGKVQA